ncbi:hypothetical protein BV25DRAFT_1827783 [Artomyces pyxidatus]|uniref:Uncharacterized protein n=1 Tax=Artomyces pyxidatus TaxID=48021 RepID=A0ACB8SWR0_9AGAM|nr:hypothetical protein BV25DRAFT_1827783 [Artomyces pyxidatus]
MHSPIPSIHRLPTELLIQMFRHVRSIEDYPGWTTVSRVCRHWRTVLSACPEHWRRVPLPSADLTRLSLAFAIRLSIRTEDFHAHRISAHAMRLALAEMARVSELHIDCSQYALSAADRQALCVTSAPALESLHLSLRAQDGPLPKTLFCGQAPRLRDLRIQGSGLQWVACSSLLEGSPRLSALSLVSTPSSPRIWSSAADMFHALRSFPELSCLELSGVLPRVPYPRAEERLCAESASRRLRRLSVRDDFSVLAPVMGYWQVDDSVDLELDCKQMPIAYDPDDPDACDESVSFALASMLMSVSHAPDDPDWPASFKSLQVRETLEASEVRLFDASMDASDEPLSGSVTIRLQWPHAVSHWASSRVCVPRVLGLLPVEGVRSICADYEQRDWGTYMWRHLSRMQQVQMARLVGHGAPTDFARALGGKLCPKLRIVHVENSVTTAGSFPRPAVVYTTLAKALRDRCRRDAKHSHNTRLTIRDSSGVVDHMQIFNTGHVDWDRRSSSQQVYDAQ